jgi:hypothetical protein
MTMATETARQAALRAINEARLTDAGYQYLIGFLASENPDVIHRALDSLKRSASEDPSCAARYLKAK